MKPNGLAWSQKRFGDGEGGLTVFIRLCSDLFEMIIRVARNYYECLTKLNFSVFPEKDILAFLGIATVWVYVMCKLFVRNFF